MNPEPWSPPWQAIVAAARAQARLTSDDVGRSALLLHTKRDLYLLAFQVNPIPPRP
jgi:hypothetical protein